MEVKDIKSKVWKLPDWAKFDNIKLDYKLYGDYATLIEKVHICPRDYYLERFGKKEKQEEEWDAIFTFSRVPKTGYMSLTWI